MAKNQSIEDLYITLGLDVSELTSDFIEVDKTISENLAKINRDKNFIKLNAQIEMNNLDPVKDAQKILQVKTNELTDLIEGQRQKVKLLEAAWLDLANSHGYSSDIARRAEETHLRETVALQELERELRQLEEAQGSVNGEQLSAFAQALQSEDATTAIESIKNAFSDMTDEVAQSNPILQKAINVISKFKNPYVVAGAGAVALATFPLVAHKASESLINMARPAIEAGDAIYQLSRRMGESVKSASQFNDACKLAGTDADYLLEQLEDLSKDWLTGGSEKTDALKAFGVDLTDDEGNLKSYHDRMVELAEGMKRAEEAGQKLEYQQMLTEENTAEMITAVENYGRALERVGDITKNGLGNPLEAKELAFDMRVLDAQADELSRAFSAALVPVAKELIPTVTSNLKHMVDVVNQNKDTIKELGEIAGTALSSIAGLAKYAANALAAVAAGLREVLEDDQQKQLDVFVKDDSIQSAEDLRKKMEDMGQGIMQNDPMMAQVAGNAEFIEATYQRMYAKIEEARQANVEKQKQADAEEQASAEDTAAKLLSEELKKLKESLDTEESNFAEQQYKATHTALQNEIYDINQWKDAMMKSAEAVKASEEDKARVVKLAEAKIQEAIRKSTEESKQRAQEYLAEAQEIASEKTASAYEREIAKIEEWKQKAKEKADTVQDLGAKAEEVAAIEINAAAKAAKAYEDEVERIKNATKSFQDEIYELTHSQYENEMRKIMEKYQQGLKEGVDKSVLDDWMRVKVAKVNEDARTQKGYTRGKFSYNPSYEVPDYVGQVQEHLGVPANATLYQNSAGKMYEAAEIIRGVSKDFQSTAGQQSPVYDVFGNLKEGWTEMSGGFGKILSYTGELANKTQQLQQATQAYGSQVQRVVSQQSKMPVNISGREPGWTQVYDIAGNKMEGWLEKYGSFGHIITNTLAEETANLQTKLQDMNNADLLTANQQLQNASQYAEPQPQNDYSQIIQAIHGIQVPVENPTINVNIDSAVTQDSEAMTWLADIVANKIAPIVENAVGGGSNSY